MRWERNDDGARSTQGATDNDGIEKEGSSDGAVSDHETSQSNQAASSRINSLVVLPDSALVAEAHFGFLAVGRGADAAGVEADGRLRVLVGLGEAEAHVVAAGPAGALGAGALEEHLGAGRVRRPRGLHLAD